MEKSADAFRSIGEVAKLIGVAPHVLRYWETQFSQLKPVKRRDGRRYYRPDDVRLAAGLCEVLREEGLTIRGAKKMLARDRGETVRNRGAARLGEAAAETTSAAPTIAAVETAVEAEAPPAKRASQAPVSAPPAPRHAPLIAPIAAAQGGDDAPHAPRARARHRRRESDSLPLFPELTPDPARIDWLARLAATAAALRAQPSGRPLNRKTQVAAQRLRDAVEDLF